MGLLSESEALRALNHQDNIASKYGNGNGTVKKLYPGGRHPGDKNIPPETRVVVGTLANLDSTRNVAEAFGISHSQVHALKHGKTDQDGAPNPDLVERIESSLGVIQDKAIVTLMESLKLITPDKLSKLKVRELSGVAKDMAGVIERTTPKKEIHNHGPTLVVYTPKPNEEADYEVVEAPAPRG